MLRLVLPRNDFMMEEFSKTVLQRSNTQFKNVTSRSVCENQNKHNEIITFCFQDANTFVPNNANVAGVCKESDAETLLLTFKDFALEFSFSKVSACFGHHQWLYSKGMRQTWPNPGPHQQFLCSRAGRPVVYLDLGSNNLEPSNRMMQLVS